MRFADGSKSNSIISIKKHNSIIKHERKVKRLGCLIKTKTKKYRKKGNIIVTKLYSAD